MHPIPSFKTRRALAVLVWILAVAPAFSQGLNDTFGLSLWKDESLWDDTARGAAERLGLRGVSNSGGESYRGEFMGQRTVLGAKLYAIDLYGNNGTVQRVVFGFLNKADLLQQLGYSSTSPKEVIGPFLIDFDRDLGRERDAIRGKLILRLGQPIESGKAEIWQWVGQQLVLERSREALTLTIQKGQYAPATSASEKAHEMDQTVMSPAGYVKRSGEGDVYIDGIPPISQGNRGFCVPAAWEKYLRHYGLTFNVYDLADEGRTTAFGSSWIPFARGVGSRLGPLGYSLVYERSKPDNFALLKKYIDQGLPLLWCLDAQLLREWVDRNAQRTTHLPASPRYTSKSPRIAGHGILIIGYNAGYKEIALSDSTDLGHSIPQIWVPAEEIRLCDLNQELIAILPPNSRVTPSTGFLKAREF